jgi:hypothetical protein
VITIINGRSFQNGRPSPVHRPTERPDIPRRRPQGPDDADDQCQSGGGVLGELRQRPLDGVGDRPGAHIGQHTDQLTGLALLAEQAEQRYQREQSGEQREHRVVRECGGEVGALVIGELPQRLAGDVLPRRFRQLHR